MKIHADKMRRRLTFNYAAFPALRASRTEQQKKGAAKWKARHDAKMKREKRRNVEAGFTAVELVTVLGFFATFGIIVYVVAHFIIKHW